MKNRYEVIVGNIGTVYDGNNKKEAQKNMNEYIEQSNAQYGRASGEDVTLFTNGEPTQEYFGRNNQEED